jgi:hypothetical protein
MPFLVKKFFAVKMLTFNKKVEMMSNKLCWKKVNVVGWKFKRWQSQTYVLKTFD